ncbi:lactate utilization protein [Thermodesulfobacteriota bacterium]
MEINNFEVFLADTPDDARDIILQKIFPKTEAKSVSWGDSLSLYATGILDVMKQNLDLDVIETFDDTVPREEIIERRRQALLVDLFFTGTNAVTQSGMLVNLDMVGNRVGAITFGPRYVVVVVGRNKIVSDLDAAMKRVKNIAAPINAIRHRIKTPCVKTAVCMDCKSPDRICNTWTMTEKSYPKGRIKIVLINRELGL